MSTLPDGRRTEHRYDGWSSEQYDAAGRKRRTERDCAGRTVQVQEFTGRGIFGRSGGYEGSWMLYASTSYRFDLLDRLVEVSDAAGNRTSLSYDALGRKTRLVDPDMGTWNYEYDPLGTLRAQTDARGQRIEFFYDALKREVRRWYALAWTSPSPRQPSVHDLMELRAAVDTDARAAGLLSPTWPSAESRWEDAAIVAGTGVKVRARHLVQLRERIGELWSAGGLGAVPEFSGGPISGSPRLIKASDLADLRGWLGQYEQSAWGSSRRARVFAEYDGYDAAAGQYGRGQRTALWDASGRASVRYDLAGRLVHEERLLDGRSYVTQSSYDAADRVAATTLPGGEVLTSSYDDAAEGRLSGLSSSLGPELVGGVQYTALGQPKQFQTGGSSGARWTQRYYGLEGESSSGGVYGALKQATWQQGSSSALVDRTLGYDAAGNVASLADGTTGESQAFEYDDLDRLLRGRWAAAAPEWDEQYTYSAVGNLLSKQVGTSAAQAYSYGDSAHVHAVTGALGNAYVYDANGSMVSRGSQSVSYDPERRPMRLEQGGQVAWRAVYDGDGVRRKRLDANGTIHYLGAYERNVGNGRDTTETTTTYYTALGRLLAYRQTTTPPGGASTSVLRWVGVDHLGSTIRVADGSFAPLSGGSQRYTPFGVGREAATGLGTDHRFTGQIEEASTAQGGSALYWYQSRAYDPALGRFVCPDTIVPEPGKPQALNRYSYVYNNPLKYTDPSGHWSLEQLDAWRAEFKSQHHRDPGEHEVEQWILQKEGWSNEAIDDWINTSEVRAGGIHSERVGQRGDSQNWILLALGLAALSRVLPQVSFNNPFENWEDSGPYYWRTETSNEAVAMIQRSGRLWGYQRYYDPDYPTDSGVGPPVVQAMVGRLPAHITGPAIEFTTRVRPGSIKDGQANWNGQGGHLGYPADSGVITTRDARGAPIAIIPIKVTQARYGAGGPTAQVDVQLTVAYG